VNAAEKFVGQRVGPTRREAAHGKNQRILAPFELSDIKINNNSANKTPVLCCAHPETRNAIIPAMKIKFWEKKGGRRAEETPPFRQ